jgi:hypothetical protein
MAGDERLPIEEKVDVAVGCRLDTCEPVERSDSGDDLLGNRPWCFAEPARELEGERDGEIAGISTGTAASAGSSSGMPYSRETVAAIRSRTIR